MAGAPRTAMSRIASAISGAVSSESQTSLPGRRRWSRSREAASVAVKRPEEVSADITASDVTAGFRRGLRRRAADAARPRGRRAPHRLRAGRPPRRSVPSLSTPIAWTRPILSRSRISWPIFRELREPRRRRSGPSRSGSHRAGPAGGSAARRSLPRAARPRSRCWQDHLQVRRRDRRAAGSAPDEDHSSAGPSAIERAHRGEHPLAGGDRVDLSLHQAVDIGLAGPRREVIHLVVPQEAQARRDAGVAEGIVQRRRHRHGHPRAVDHREVRRRRLLAGQAPRGPPSASRGAGSIEATSDCRRGRSREQALAHAGEGRVPEPAVAVVERPLLDLRQPVHRLDAAAHGSGPEPAISTISAISASTGPEDGAAVVKTSAPWKWKRNGLRSLAV